MSNHLGDQIQCQQFSNFNPKLIVAEHFKLCKAKFQKRKFIQKQSKE